jgi:hypothetical protein
MILALPLVQHEEDVYALANAQSHRRAVAGRSPLRWRWLGQLALVPMIHALPLAQHGRDMHALAKVRSHRLQAGLGRALTVVPCLKHHGRPAHD